MRTKPFFGAANFPRCTRRRISITEGTHEGAGTEDPCLCGGYGKTQGFSSFGHREPGDCTESKNITQRSGKPASRIDDLLMDLGASYEILGRWRLNDNHWRNRARKRVVQTHPPPLPAGIPEVHHALVYNDLRNPGLEARLSAKGGAIPEGRKVSRLDGVLGLVARRQYSTRHSERRSIVSLEQLGDRAHISVPKIRDQLQYRFVMHSLLLKASAMPA